MAELTFTARRGVLLSVVEKAATVVSAKEIYPLLSNFLVEARDRHLRVIATDMELSVLAETSIVAVQGEGRVLIPAKKLMALLREAAEGDVTVAVSGGGAKVTAGPTAYSLVLRPPDEYPDLADVADAKFTDVPRKGLLRAIQLVKPAASRDGTSPRLMAIEVAAGRATAGSQVRMHQAVIPGFPADMQLQIPIGAADDLARLLREDEFETVGVAEAGYVLAFRIGDDIFMSGKLPSAYPEEVKNRLRTAVTSHSKEVTVNAGDLRQAVRRVRITADPETSAVGLRLAGGRMAVVSQDKYGNAAEEAIGADWAGPDRLVVVNHAFLTELLELAEGPSAVFLLGNDTTRKRSMLVLRDEQAGTTGAIGQLPANLVGYE